MENNVPKLSKILDSQFNLKISENTEQLEINIQDLPAGFYILDIMSSNNDSFTTKFIKP